MRQEILRRRATIENTEPDSGVAPRRGAAGAPNRGINSTATVGSSRSDAQRLLAIVERGHGRSRVALSRQYMGMTSRSFHASLEKNASRGATGATAAGAFEIGAARVHDPFTFTFRAASALAERIGAAGERN